MLVIRLLRTGKKNQPSFKIVVVEKIKSSTSGRFIEQVGFYNPLTKEKVLRGERIKYWLSVGAKPLGTVHNLLVSEKIVAGKKIPKHKKAKKLEEDKSSSPSRATAKGEEESLLSSPSKEGSEKKEETVLEKPTPEKPKEENSQNPK